MPLLATAGARGLSLLNVLSLAQPITLCFVANHLVAQPFTSGYMSVFSIHIWLLGAASRFLLMHEPYAAAHVVLSIPSRVTSCDIVQA